MLKRAAEWYRIVDVKPSGKTIDNRSAAVRSVIDSIEKADDHRLLLNCAAGVVAGFDVTSKDDSPVVRTLVEAIKAADSAFPGDLSENALELRVCAALALGEILEQGDDVDELSDSALLAASVLRSGLSSRRSQKGKHLKQMLDELNSGARTRLTAGGNSRRRSLDSLVERFQPLPAPANLPAAIQEAMAEIAQQSAIDREELNVLWWMFAGVSVTTASPISELETGAAVLCCGGELGTQCLIPPTPGIEGMVRAAYCAGRSGSGLTDRTLKEVATAWTNELPTVLVPDQNAKELAQTYPSLFPLSWLCNRLLESGGKTKWSVEFDGRTGISATQSQPPVSWAIQVFLERVAQRAHAQALTD